VSILNLNGPAGRSPRGKRAVKVWMGIGLVIAVLGVGSTLASTITINGGTNQEFGQGVQRTVYCGGEQKITVTPVSSYLNVEEPTPIEDEDSAPSSDSPTSAPTPTDLAGTFYLSGITVSDIPEECSGVDFVFSVFDQKGHSTPIPISTLDGDAITTPTVYWYYNPESNVQPNYGALLSSSRTEFKDGSAQMQIIPYLPNMGKGSFKIDFSFDNPLNSQRTQHANIDDVGRIIIETQNDVIYKSVDPMVTRLVTPASR